MTTRVDDSRSSLRGSYFELLYEKYPDLAPATRMVAPSARTGERSTDAPQRGFESLWVPGLLMAALALALLFPPALLWQPSWLNMSSPTDGATAITAELSQGPEHRATAEPRQAVTSVQTPEPSGLEAPSSHAAVTATVHEGDLLASKDREIAALVAAERRALAASAARRQATRETIQPAVGDASEADQVRSVEVPASQISAAPISAAQTSAAQASAAQVSLVAESALPELHASEASLDGAPETPATDFLEVATAGPRIQPARRLLGEAPQVAAVEQPTRLRLRNHINPQGEVVGVDVLQGLSHEHDRLMADALRQWRYEPATVDGRPVSSQQEVVFVLMPDGGTQLAQADPVEPARRRVTPLPGYTQEAWIQGTEGEVELLASIDARGEVTEVEVVSGLPHGLTQSAVQAVERWKFDPARQKGEAVASTQRLRLRFAL